jgi:hypothetical protein
VGASGEGISTVPAGNEDSGVICYDDAACSLARFLEITLEKNSVEDDRFDRLAKFVGRRTTRRFAFGAAALVVGFTGPRWDLPGTEAAGSSACQGLDPSQIISKNNCGRTPCGATAGCVCMQTPGHHVRCAARFEPPDDCPPMNECSARRPCPRGQFCAKVLGCCGGRSGKVCVRPCPA